MKGQYCHCLRELQTQFYRVAICGMCTEEAAPENIKLWVVMVNCGQVDTRPRTGKLKSSD